MWASSDGIDHRCIRKSHRSSVQWLIHFIAFILTWCFRKCFRGAFEPHSRLSHKEYWIVNCFRGDFAVFHRIDNTENRSIMHFRFRFRNGVCPLRLRQAFARLSLALPSLSPSKALCILFFNAAHGKMGNSWENPEENGGWPSGKRLHDYGNRYF